ncbi:hypothetical protein A2690_01895 [Candidatus Roizmanbacteria bacterium RIFCSPHIGHO2_01_FULL_39_12b]|uniref:Beta-ketoacyl-ACP reductase n=1 Tax=Candidatus Roizmanbacteria bacterium RIFCSPHIGHO2_01_FULL_39_12b TaxID=1802030 RepID=A0A1F7GB77_9BACT|nr:MAG: hypothetical protein A2690_01895 [Candidatus Roizmanbacteria bacterium RIFCSPHIGHO2_01_FULL_39_12b]OGK46174.1 MAG: hypothetical protein A3B46_03140 [Candidatus Roizmanbacteria bacterium RIFCSPLOWO2_01_FULL_39_19]
MVDLRFQNKVVLITGAARGIGRAIALAFAKEGAKIVVNHYKSKKEANKLVAEIKKIGPDAIAIRADISEINEIKKLVKESIIKFKGIDIIINNAGIQLPAPINETTEEMWDNTFDINLKGAFFCIKEVLPYMKQKTKGKIINISSIAALVGSLVSVSYGSSKAGVSNMTKTLSRELGKYNITINVVAPGPTDTDLMRNLGKERREILQKETPLGRIATPEDIAKAVLFFASNKADFITGQTLIVDGGRI